LHGVGLTKIPKHKYIYQPRFAAYYRTYRGPACIHGAVPHILLVLVRVKVRAVLVQHVQAQPLAEDVGVDQGGEHAYVGWVLWICGGKLQREVEDAARVGVVRGRADVAVPRSTRFYMCECNAATFECVCVCVCLCVCVCVHSVCCMCMCVCVETKRDTEKRRAREERERDHVLRSLKLMGAAATHGRGCFLHSRKSLMRRLIHRRWRWSVRRLHFSTARS
jgi:hypothetical protein